MARGEQATTAQSAAVRWTYAPSRRAGILALAFVALTFVALLSLAVGSRAIGLSTTVHALTSYDPTNQDELIVHDVRVPRTLIGLMVGAALGLAGGLMQGVTRNPLADPGLLGVTAGAATAIAVAVLVAGVGALTGYVWFAFAGAAIGVVVVYGIASFGRDGPTPIKLALAGAAVSALFTSITTLLVLRDLDTLNALRFWLVGSIAERGGDIAREMAPFVLVGTVLALACGRLLNGLALGEDVARSLGQRVVRTRALVGACVVLLAGTATAAAGPIVFVGLVVPHVARAITGPDYRWILAYCAVLAPLMLLAADIAGRVVAPPRELGVSVVTVLVGGPLFIALVRRRTPVEL
jgi:iron complex transport system permease protein